MEQSKKKSKSQLEHEISSAIVFVPKKNAKTIHLEDRGITLSVTDDFTVISTNFHRNVFNNYNSEGVSPIHSYITLFIDIAEKYKEFGEIKDDKGNVTGFSFGLLMGHKDEIDIIDLNLILLVDRWLMVLTEPQYVLYPSDISSLNLTSMYISFLAKSNALLRAREGDIMYYDFFNEYISSIRYLALDNSLDCEGLFEEVLKVENEALDKIRAFIKSKGLKLEDKVIVEKQAFTDIE